MATLAELQDRLARVRGKERRYIAVQGICRVLVTLALAIVVIFALDWLVDLPYGARLLAAGVGLTLVGYVAWRYLFVELSKIHDDDEMALRVEARNSELRGRLISTLQLTRTEKSGAYAGSHEMIHALEDETLQMASPLDFSRVVSTVMLKRLLIVAAIVLTVKGVLVYCLPGYFAALAERLINPEKQYPTRTRLLKVEVPEFVPRGEDIPVTVSVDPTSKVPEKDGKLLFIQPKTNMMVPVELNPSPKDGNNARLLFEGKLSRALEDVDLIVELGDVRTKRVSIHVVARPEVDTARSVESLRYKLPDYTEEPLTAWQKFGGISALQASTAEIKFTSTKPLKSAVIERSDGRKFPLTALPSPPQTDPAKPREPECLTWSLSGFPIDKSGTFHVALLDTNNLTNSLPALEYPIDARPDLAPTIKLMKPSRDMTVVPTARVNVKYSARDDYGLRMVWLVYYIQTNEGSEGGSSSDGRPESEQKHDTKKIEFKVDRENGKIRRDLTAATLQLALADLKVKIGDQVVFWLECDDFCDANDEAPRKTKDGELDTTPGVKVYPRTNDIKLTVISRQDKEAELRAELARLFQMVERSAKTQEELKAQVLEIQEELQRLKQ